ncbi:protein CcmA, bactofilin family [Oryzisolibacter propanilivorax]|uniref:Protein CcmA, bactofilin family n=1 Tax=Oryzisolibacter propanilivorax TaxID=1527607 RepID=A0A1G9S2Q5_9BURK|nr:polymer-forming cytoskeletal protein [Oryzisolibacter propanilivorax]SDM29848.1 protein CcmA, bactofilin family [Oryzisolibacter propanilivorax]
MAVQNPFFGKRDSVPSNPGASDSNFAARQPAGLGGIANRAAMPATGTTSMNTSTPATPATSTAASGSEAPATGGSKLTVGPNIKLKGVEITDCDTLVVEGTVEATMDSRVIHIAEQGAFKGCAEIDIAEIHGQFDGQLTVREKLVIFGSGRVSGKIRYGKVVIEEGGQLTGEISVGSGPAPAAARAPSTVAATGTPARSEVEALQA